MLEDNQMAHAKAIIMLKEDLNYKELVFRIASFAPQVFLDSIDYDPDTQLKGSLEQQICDMHSQGLGKLSIIKWYRGETWVGLKEAKDFLDKTCTKFDLTFS